MKKLKFVLFFLLMVSFSFLVACGEKTYKVSFVTNCEETIAAQEVVENEKATKPTDPTKEGYLFLGWFIDEVEYTFEEAVTANITLIAKWEEIKYTVTFETGCDQSIDPQQVSEKGKATKPADPIKEGYKFLGWFNGEVEYTFEEAVTGDITLTAKWEEIKYTVTFETGCDQTIEPEVVKANAKATKPADPVKEGYKFLGWFNGEVAYTFEEAVTGDITLTAKWELIKTYTITFKANDKVIATVVVEEGSAAVAPTAPIVEGMAFVRWEGNYTNVTEDAEVVAVYEVVTYTVQFKVDGQNYGDAYSVKYGETCPKPADPEKAGYTFAGWDKDFTVVNGNLVINAEFDAIQYDIKYYSGSKEITNIEPKKYTIEDAIALNPYDLTGYYFYGWYANSDFSGDVVYQIELGTTGEIKFYALNVKVDVNGGADCWTTETTSDWDPNKGIDEISNLPEIFEMDFFKYLSDNNLLADSQLDSTCIASSWEVFSGVNPNHNGDPKRIWNDTSSATAANTNGYVSLFLYETIEVNADLTIKDVKGGFLGTEPYKTKYRGLINLLSVMYQYKVDNNNYTTLSTSNAKSRALLGFVIDGYFYGTQGAGSSYLAAARNVIPGIAYSYKVNGEIVEKFTFEGTAMPTPVKDGYVFAGWCLDKACTKLLKDNKLTNLCTLYAKWEQIK